jgi:hypothetical protein
MMHDYRGRKVIHHGGATDGMGSFVGLVPEERLGVVVLQNTSQSPLLSFLGFHIIDSFLGEPADEWPDLKAIGAPAPGGAPEEGSPGTPPSLPLARYAGVYHHPMYEQVTVAVEQGNLVLRFDRSLSSMWDRVFGSQLDASFQVGTAGISELSIQHFGTFTRLQDAPSTG